MSCNMCPHCNEHRFGLWAKLALNPRRASRCPLCDGPVSVSKRSSALNVLLLGAMPLLFCLLAIAIANSSSASGWLLPAIGVAIGVGLELWLYYRAVPLVAHVAHAA
jgi:hypothetical protein